MKINIQRFREMISYFKEINKTDLRDIEIDDVENIDKLKEEWNYVGMNSVHFINFLIKQHDEGNWPLNTIWKDNEKQTNLPKRPQM